MAPRLFNYAYNLSIFIILLSIITSLGGLFFEDLYRDNLLVSSGWIGNDLVTLLLAVPLFIIALIGIKRDSSRAKLLWLGLLFYTLYNYAFYLFGAAFNYFFLFYVALFILSMVALVFGMISLKLPAHVPKGMNDKALKLISGYILLVIAMLGGFHIGLSASYWFTGEIPEIISKTGHPTNVISALDLSFVVTGGFIAAIWLWQQKKWGYILATVWNVKGFVYMLALSAATINSYLNGASDELSLVAIWGGIAIGCFIASIMLLRRA